MAAPAMFTESEQKRLILGCCYYNEDMGATEDQIKKVMDWACATRSDALLLELALEGKIVVGVDADGEINMKVNPPKGGARQ